MPLLPNEFAELIAQLQERDSLRAYHAAQRLEQLRSQMSDEQRAAHAAALGRASHARREANRLIDGDEGD